MAKQNNTIFLIIGGILVAFLVGSQLGLFAIGGASMTRSVPSTVSPSSSFTVTYKVSGVSGNYGVSVVDSVSGGCTPSGEYKFVMADDTKYTTSKSITYKAPSSGSCTFNGDYKFGTEAIKNFPDKIITVTTGNGNGDDGNGNGNGDDGNGENGVPTDGNGENGINGNGNGENGYVPPTFNLGMVLFSIGSLNITLLMLLISVVALFVIKMMFSK